MEINFQFDIKLVCNCNPDKHLKSITSVVRSNDKIINLSRSNDKIKTPNSAFTDTDYRKSDLGNKQNIQMNNIFTNN